MTIKLAAQGIGQLRYGDDTVPALQWNAVNMSNKQVLGELFMVPGVGSFEFWHDGEMFEFASWDEARRTIEGR